MLPLHLQDPWIFMRKSLENAVDAHDEETIRKMSDMIDKAMADYNRAASSDSAEEQTG